MGGERYPEFGFVTPDTLGLLVDLYELVMADSYLREGLNDQATFDLFVRSLPPNRAFLVSAGLETALAYLEAVRFTDEAIAYLRGLRLFSDAFLDYLREFRFTGDVWAVPEGEVVFPPEPLVEVTAPRIEAQLVETFLLNTFNFQVMIASKAARVVLAAGGRAVVDFSPRRDHGADAALKAARASYVAGCAGTSNVLAGLLYGIPVYGTMAHSYVMSYPDELTAFRAFARDFPRNAILLIDTYDTLQGARHAVAVAREMAARGDRLRGVRIDSYESLDQLAEVSRRVRAIFDEAGLVDVQIILSGDLDEYKIAEVLARGAAAQAFGVGTRMGTSEDAPSLGGVYKLVEDTAGPKIKLSAGKATLPGRKQVWRARTADGGLQDTIALREEPAPPGSTPLLVPVMSGGRVIRQDSLAQMRARCAAALRDLPPPLRVLHGTPPSPVSLSPELRALQAQMFQAAARPGDSPR
ncbi:MAG: nicotinate phosphoribosyltransferase [Armatimonadota bacterium]|nr:nicotinate phosphoribosyltransferase [Armatimonadota bacterium]MDR7401625.1 nicotinate phosphoribosyltransferase [Armatimonadota bacterium]MDR7404313.1 nicotinate phosphoribosyltransferase [Armatimonadota bacterium]MDR7436891.1 nicotinate phosphoribosyltransferase [Armatimonadota bacterium]MDR7471569.1 nicotinate phosphoribosyltransferase [Armatimonadota bacterium]